MPENLLSCRNRPVVSFTILLFATILSLSCGSDSPGPESGEAEPQIAPPQIEATAPLEISKSPEDTARCARIAKLIEDRNASYERWGVMAVSLKDGRVLCGVNPRKLFSPASIQKIIVAAAALENLGADYSVRTSVYASAPASDGIIDGDLTLYGRGAPDLGKAGIATLVSRLRSKGIREVTGNIIGDESYFKGDGLGDGWTWNEAQWYYGAEASALTYEKNRVKIRVRNRKPSADSSFVNVSGSLRPVESIEAVGLRRKLGTNDVFVWGFGKDLDARVAVNEPALHAALVFKKRLEESGIRVGGKALSTDWTRPGDPQKLQELASVESAALADIVREMNKDSVNIYAELLIRAIGKKLGDEAPDEDPKMNLLRGDDLAGAAFLEKWIIDNSAGARRTAIHDGSGLSRLNRLSPEVVVRILIHAAKEDYARPFTESLPVSGRDGTMKNRIKRYSGRVLAKTGSITYANSLAGYIESRKETLAFGIICNDETERNDSTATIDAIVSELMGQDG